MYPRNQKDLELSMLVVFNAITTLGMEEYKWITIMYLVRSAVHAYAMTSRNILDVKISYRVGKLLKKSRYLRRTIQNYSIKEICKRINSEQQNPQNWYESLAHFHIAI